MSRKRDRKKLNYDYHFWDDKTLTGQDDHRELTISFASLGFGNSEMVVLNKCCQKKKKKKPKHDSSHQIAELLIHTSFCWTY